MLWMKSRGQMWRICESKWSRTIVGKKLWNLEYTLALAYFFFSVVLEGETTREMNE